MMHKSFEAQNDKSDLEFGDERKLQIAYDAQSDKNQFEFENSHDKSIAEIQKETQSSVESVVPNLQTCDQETYLNHFSETVEKLFSDEKSDIHKSPLSRETWEHLVRNGALLTYLPESHGGRPSNMEENLKLLSKASYHSLPLSLMVGIVGGLCIDPVKKYAQEDIKKEFLDDIAQGKTSAFAITEPDFGSDAFHMQTSFENTPEGVNIQGTKHWQGLSSEDTDWWIIAAREKRDDASLGSSLHFFLHKNEDKNIRTTPYETQGLWMIPYGKNEIDITVPAENKLETEDRKGLRMLLNMLCTSRLQFPGMAQGFLQRNYEEALAHTQKRMIQDKPLLSYDQAEFRVAQLQTWSALCDDICTFLGKNIDLSQDLSDSLILANSMKALMTDYMQESAQSFQQLMGSHGYEKHSRASKATADSRPFQIFEGPNDILYSQITEALIRNMRREQAPLSDYLATLKETQQGITNFYDDLNFHIDGNLSQRKRQILGQIVARLIALQMVEESDNPIQENELSLLTFEIKTLLSQFHTIPDIKHI